MPVQSVSCLARDYAATSDVTAVPPITRQVAAQQARQARQAQPQAPPSYAAAPQRSTSRSTRDVTVTNSKSSRPSNRVHQRQPCGGDRNKTGRSSDVNAVMTSNIHSNRRVLTEADDGFVTSRAVSYMAPGAQSSSSSSRDRFEHKQRHKSVPIAALQGVGASSSSSSSSSSSDVARFQSNGNHNVNPSRNNVVKRSAYTAKAPAVEAAVRDAVATSDGRNDLSTVSQRHSEAHDVIAQRLITNSVAAAAKLCDVNIRGTTTTTTTTSDDDYDRLERRHVHDVYDKTARHFGSARYKAWPNVRRFLQALATGSLVADVGMYVYKQPSWLLPLPPGLCRCFFLTMILKYINVCVILVASCAGVKHS